jgi:hypothetical protein
MLSFVLLFSLSCDGSSKQAGDLAECGGFTACGGSLVGTWKTTKFCSEGGSVITGNCTMTIDASEYAPSATYTFAGDKTFSLQVTVNGKMTTDFSQGCFTGATTCEQRAESPAPSNSGITRTCASGAAGDCQCTETYSDATGKKEGTYSTSGTSLSLSMGTKDQPPMDYCVQGNRLTLRASGSTKVESVVTAEGSSMMILEKQ